MSAPGAGDPAVARLYKMLPENVTRLIEDAIQSHLDAAEALILCLDEMDGDQDLEDEHDGREPDEDEEPSLGFTNDLNQTRAARSSSLSCSPDLEHEHDGREPTLAGWSGPTHAAVEELEREDCL